MYVEFITIDFIGSRRKSAACRKNYGWGPFWFHFSRRTPTDKSIRVVDYKRIFKTGGMRSYGTNEQNPSTLIVLVGKVEERGVPELPRTMREAGHRQRTKPPE